MSFSGVTLGFTKGWSLALVMLGIAPVIVIGMLAFTAALKKRMTVVMKAYG